MKILYQSFDGYQFDNERDCLLHEENNPQFIMYDTEGYITNDPDSASIIELKTDQGIEKFIEVCKNATLPVTGVGCHGKGVYLWVREIQQYVYLSNFTISTLKNYLCGD